MAMRIFLALLCCQVTLGANLLTLDAWPRGSTRPVCCDADELSCTAASVHLDVLGQPKLSLPGGIEVVFEKYVNGDKNALQYSSVDADLFITYSPYSKGIFGRATLSNGRTFLIENCGIEGHVWMELDVEHDMEEKEDDAIFVDFQGDDYLFSHGARRGVKPSKDNHTIFTYSIKVYMTSEFKKHTPKHEEFINSAIKLTNKGYENSKVPLVATLHCIELATIREVKNGSRMIANFRYMKGSEKELRGSADAAVLLVSNSVMGSGGVGYSGHAIDRGLTISVTKKKYAHGYFTFGHELGHNLGLAHNLEVPDAKNKVFPYGHGYLIKAGKFQTGFRTIMAYRARGHYYRINFYSNPRMINSNTSTPMGIEGVSDNVALLLRNREALSKVGDESIPCKPLALNSPKPNCSHRRGELTQLMTTYSVEGNCSAKECDQQCTTSSNCEGWQLMDDHRCKLFELKTSSLKGYESGAMPGTATCGEILSPSDKECSHKAGFYLHMKNRQGKRTDTPVSCRRQCAETENCKAWTWQKDNNSCVLSVLSGSKLRNVKAAAGLKFC